MPNYKEFEGANLITDPTEKALAAVLLRIDHAGMSNSGFSFGENQMDSGYNSEARGQL